MAGLMDIPGIGPFMQARQQIGAENAQRQQQAIGLMGLMAQQEKIAEERQMAPLRSRLLSAQAADLEAKPEDRRLQQEGTRQIALQRLSQSAARDASELEFRARNAKTREEALHWTQQMDVLRANERRQASEIAAGRYNYDTGGTIAPFRGAIPVPGAPGAPPMGGSPGEPVREVAPNDQAALARMIALDQAGQQGSVTGPAPGNGAPMPVSAPAGPTRASSYGPEGRFPPVGGAASQPMQVPLSAVTEVPQPGAPAPAAPQMPQFSGSPREQAAARNRWTLEQSKSSIAGAGNFSPEALKFTAQQYLAGDVQAAQGFARSATARIALQEAIVQEAMKQGLSPSQVAAKKAEFAGVMSGSRTVGTRAANISLAATEAQEMIPIVKETSDKFSRTNFVPWNKVLQMWETNTGGPEIAEFGAALNSLVNVYARAIAPSGVPTVSDKDHAREMLNRVQSPAQVAGVLGIMNRELEIAKKAPGTVREAMRQGVTGETPAAPQRRASDSTPVRKYNPATGKLE